jgi:hypothetical protein
MQVNQVNIDIRSSLLRQCAAWKWASVFNLLRQIRSFREGPGEDDVLNRRQQNLPPV